MSPRDFCYWLQGALEVMDPKTMTEEQVNIIKKHLDLVFVNVTKSQEPVDVLGIFEKMQKAPITTLVC